MPREDAYHTPPNARPHSATVDYPGESFTASERTGSPPLSQDGATVRLFYGTAADSVLELAPVCRSPMS